LCAKPGRQLNFGQVTRRQLQESFDNLDLGRGEIATIENEKRRADHESGALVAVREWMVARQPGPTGCGQCRDVGVGA
jgi:hypothetical protein